MVLTFCTYYLCHVHLIALCLAQTLVMIHIQTYMCSFMMTDLMMRMPWESFLALSRNA